MSLLEKASLIVTPNAYKESILYSVVPNTTLGDMNVVRTTTATRVNSAGLIESVGVNVPRIDYTNGSCPSLLVEPQRTNLFLSSQQFNNVNWIKAGGTVTADVAISPDGTQNADLFNSANIYQQRIQANDATYCFSVYVKKNTATNVTIGYIDNVTGFTGGDIRYTYSTNSLTIFQSANGSVSGQAIDVGNGWIRIILKYTTITTVTFNYQYIDSNGSYVYGAQLEQGSYATSYIPTVASTVTRNADVISKTGISSLIGQTEGTLFVDLKSAYNGWITLSDNSDANAVLLSFSKEYSTLNYFIYANSVDIIGTGFLAFPSEPMKLAFKYKSGEIKLFVNGVLVYTNTATFAFSNNLSFFGNRFYWGGGLFEGSINSEQLYKTALTDAECIDLTTL